MNIRLRVLIPIVLTETLLVSVFFIHQTIEQKHHLREGLKRTSETFNSLIEAEIRADVSVMSTALSELRRDSAIPELLRAKKIDRLVAKVTPTYEHLKNTHLISHFYFHGTDRNNLYRLHEPTHYGDKINRATLVEAEKTGKPSYGVEQGPTGASVLRVVYPVSAQGNLVGYLELGKEFQDITAKIRTLMGVEALVLANKEKINRKHWESRNNKTDFTVDWDFFPTQVVMASSMKVIPGGLRGKNLAAAANPDISDTLVEGKRAFDPIMVPFADLSGARNTHIVLLYDSSTLRTQSRKAVLTTSILCVAVLAVLFSFYFVFLGRVENLVKRAETLRVERDVAERANRAKSDFLANISHELRTPMHGILSFSSFGIQKTGIAPAEKIKSYFSEIHDSGQRLMRLLNDLLDLAKLEAGKVEYVLAENDLCMIAHMVRKEFLPFAEEKRIALEIVSNADAIPLVCDADRIMQVVQNLVSNAIKFSTTESTVIINLIADNDRVRLQVSDRGINIPRAELESVFDKFVQSSKTKTGAGGTGLGLSICREIVNGHGGKIWAESTAGGETTFTMELPRKLPRHALAPKAA